MRYTLGLIELNPFEVLGDPLFSKRYYSQVVLPLLGMLEAERRFRVTLTATGAAVEHLAENHPPIFKKLRTLIEEKRIELLCSMYTNSDWQTFPSSDLMRSHRMSNAILHNHGLPLSRTMVAQHNTYWPAMAQLQDEFDVFLIRDAFLKGRRAARKFPPMARVGSSLLLVAANNFLHDMTVGLVSQKVPDEIGLFIEGRLDTAVESWTHSDPRFVDISIREDDWHWFHSAGAHHFTTGASLRNWDAFFSDPIWMRTVQDFFETKINEDLKFSLVTEFAAAVSSVAETLPDLCDADWNCDAESDVAYWLAPPEQRMRAVLSWTPLSWRSRTALRGAETMIERAYGQQQPDALSQQIKSLWRRQLWAEVSPVPTRANLSCEVDFIRENAEEVISTATELCVELASSGVFENVSTMWNNGILINKPCPALVETELINGEGTIKWFWDGNGVYQCEVRFIAEEPSCGIGFKLASNGISFSSCGDEEGVATMSIASFGEGSNTLVTPIGLYSLGTNMYLIRHNCQVSVGAQLGPGKSFIRFIVDFAPEEHRFEWPFTIVQGHVAAAIAMANRINAT